MMDEKYQKEDSRTQQEQHVLQTVTDEILSQSSERFIKLEKSHFEQLYYFIDSAIEVVMKEQTKNGNEVVDCIDRRVEKDIQDELMISLPQAVQVNRKRKLICEGCNGREGLKAAKELKKKTSDTIVKEKSISYVKLSFLQEAKNTAIKVEHDEDNVYDHVPTNHKASHQITITDPVFCNPNSYATVAMVLRKIGQDIGIYNNNVYQSTQRPNFKYMMDTVCRFSQGIVNFRMAIRRNNSDLLKSAKYMTKELFHGRQHPKYQQIEVNDTIQDMLMPENVQIINDAYSSITTSENKSTGQDFHFVLEEKNRQLKSWIPKGMPTDTIWQTVCRNNLFLEKIKENSMFMFGIHSDKGVSKSLDIDDAVYSFRCNLRSTDYLNKSVDHTSVSNVALDEQLVHFIEKATSKRMAYIRTSILNEEIESTVF
ncbi:unnamed protein product [Mytilus coruscus]|uniref:Uncharacterized protein n=1 Tax=Mytilus coruscus TaxID=42192 RepID=A0A6J8CQM9_MYTCO|nr:unnamed protein product [Mytilus coruscus]